LDSRAFSRVSGFGNRVRKIYFRFRSMGIDIAMVVKPSNIHVEDKERYAWFPRETWILTAKNSSVHPNSPARHLSTQARLYKG